MNINKKQIITALLLYILVMGGIIYWIYSSQEQLHQNRLDRYPSVDAFIQADIDTDEMIKKTNEIIKISILLNGLGLSEKLSLKAIDELPAAIDLGFSVYTTKIDYLSSKAHEDNHQTIISLPMEHKEFPIYDSGPLSLLTKNKDSKNLQTLEAVNNKLNGSIGMINFMGSSFLENGEKVKPILSKIQEMDLLFIELPVTELSKASKLAKELELKYLSPDLYIDSNISNENDIDTAFNKLITENRDKAHLFIIIEAFPNSIFHLQKWLDKNEKDKVFELLSIKDWLKDE